MEKLIHTHIKTIILYAKAGSEINNCKIEAIRIAVAENARVIMVHNNKGYEADPNTLLDCISESDNFSITPNK